MAGNTTVSKRVGMDLTQGKILHTLLAVAVPLLLADLLQQLYSMVDLIVIGQFVGSTGTVAVSTGSEVSDILTPIATGFATAGQVYIAQLMGSKNYRDVEKAVGTLLTVMLGLCVAFTIGTLAGHRILLDILNCPEEAYEQAASYMVITAFGIPFIFMYNAICGVLRGMGETRRPMVFVLVAASVNIVLDLILVVAFSLDAAGTAIATAAAQAGSAIAAMVFLYRRREYLGFTLRASSFGIDRHSLSVLLRLGIPKIFSGLCVRVSLLWCKSQINAYGLIASATYSVGNKLQKLCIVFVQSVSSGSATMVGQNLGAGKKERVRKIVWTTFACTMVSATVLSALSLLFPRQLYGIFSKDSEVIEAGVTFMRILCITFYMAGFYSSFLSVVTGSGFARLEFVTGMMDGVVCRIGFSLLFVYVVGIGVEGYYLGSALARFLPGVICLIYFLSGKWKDKKLLSERKGKT
ncbi:MAG: MATE family efflux transporter [Lachnospiraceae bacterium]|nr:MATE family efflux transporter [Lachnospiraceae bacterium]